MAGHNCDNVLQELYGFLDGELTVQRRAQIKQHLESCPPCFEGFDFEAELRIVVAQKCTERVPEALRCRIADAIAVEAFGPELAAPGSSSAIGHHRKSLDPPGGSGRLR
jgi:mycothiol system anti-sigma-R factor